MVLSNKSFAISQVSKFGQGLPVSKFRAGRNCERLVTRILESVRFLLAVHKEHITRGLWKTGHLQLRTGSDSWSIKNI